MKLLDRINKIKLNNNINKHKEEIRKRYNNGDITIISNNCLAGVIYNILGVKFFSPTINLWFKMSDYVDFLSNLEDYLNCELTENTEESKTQGFPVGTLVPSRGVEQLPSIQVYFNHYNTFESAKKKWEERKKRIIWEKLYIILQFNDRDCDIEILKRFLDLPYENKIALVHREIPDIDMKKVYMFRCVSESEPLTKIFEYNGISGIKYFEEFDYVSFLNKS